MFRWLVCFTLLLGSCFAGDLGGSFWLKGGAIYLLPSVDDSIFAAISNDTNIVTTDSKAFGLNPTFSPGYFVEGGWRFSPCWDLRLDWQSLIAIDTREVATEPGQGLYITVLNPGSGAGGGVLNRVGMMRGDLRYFQGWGSVSYWMHLGSCLDARIYGGAKGAYIRYTETMFYDHLTGSLDTFIQRISHNRGVGPLFGVALHWNFGHFFNPAFCFLENLGIFGELNCALLIGKSSNRYKSVVEISPDDLTDLQTQAEWRLIPTKEMRFGFDLCKRFCHCFLQTEFGYQLSYWDNLVQSRVFVDDVETGTNFGENRNFYTQGFFLNFALHY